MVPHWCRPDGSQTGLYLNVIRLLDADTEVFSTLTISSYKTLSEQHKTFSFSTVFFSIMFGFWNNVKEREYTLNRKTNKQKIYIYSIEGFNKVINH